MKISNDIKKTINIWCNKNCVYEIRVPKSNYFGTISGYFNDFDSLCSEAEFLSNDPKIPAVYMTLNACDPNALARSCNTTVGFQSQSIIKWHKGFNIPNDRIAVTTILNL